MPENPDPQDIILVPVDENGRVLLFTDLKIENIDRDYRTIRDPNGLTWKIIPGDYTVKVFLRNLEMKTVPLKVERGVTRYRLPVQTTTETPDTEQSIPEVNSFQFQPKVSPQPPKPSPAAEVIHSLAPAEKARHSSQERRVAKDSGSSKRFLASFPVSYRTDSGKWVQAKAVNVSASGLCVENIGRITENDNLYVRLHVPVATIPIECPARVVWVTSEDKSTPCMGLQLFLTANMRESLDRWLSGK
jgi:PilZ domain